MVTQIFVEFQAALPGQPVVCTNYRVVQKKITQSLMHCHFATVCSRITPFSQKCSEINL